MDLQDTRCPTGVLVSFTAPTLRSRESQKLPFRGKGDWLASAAAARSPGEEQQSKVGTSDNMQHGQPNRRHSIVTNTDPVDPGHRSYSPYCPHPGPYSP